MNELLAKSPHGERTVTLLQHTLDVLDAAEALFGQANSPTRLGQCWLRFFKLAEEAWPVFHINLLISAACHDWGKANDSFQEVVRGRDQTQVIRHEHLSALLLGLAPPTAWLQAQPTIDTDLVLAAVVSHHLKATADLGKLHAFAARPAGLKLVRVRDDHPEFEQLTLALTNLLALPALKLPLVAERVWSFRDERGAVRPGLFDIERQRDYLKDRRLRPFEVALRKDEQRRRLLWAVRAALIAADAAGSGLPRTGAAMRPWIEAAYDPSRLCDESFIRQEVIAKRIAELERKSTWQGWSAFQIQCDSLPGRALLLAPCGAGKTLAAWRWIAAQLSKNPAARVLFLYPTRATAKEGLRDYVSWAPEADAVLMHGTAAYDLQGMFANPDDPRHENRYEADRRLFALGFWTRRIFSATVDQFLAFLQYGYGPVCMLPVLADAVVVIDEVHSFDRNMFAALKDFLKTFDVPVLCMTATLPTQRRRELEGECGLKAYDDKPGELAEIAAAPRYRVRQTTAAEVPSLVRQVLAAGKRVLWVVNQVKRAQQAALSMSGDFQPELSQKSLSVGPGVPLFCYHSRFRLNDRVQRHNNVVERFRQGCPAALAITTQVCEMSLDLDADMLVTECCPATSLIQRMGRCNRARWPRPLEQSGGVIVYAPESREPYDQAALLGIEDFVAGLCARDWVSQADLEEALLLVPSPPWVGDPACSFLTSGPYALAGEEDFREIEEFSRPAVLSRDVAAFLTAIPSRQPGFIVPVPKRLALERDEQRTQLPSYLAVALDDHYHQALGYCDKPLQVMRGTI